jgi:hypothetical protein
MMMMNHDIFDSQTSEILQPLSKLSHQSLRVLKVADMLLINKYG